MTRFRTALIAVGFVCVPLAIGACGSGGGGTGTTVPAQPTALPIPSGPPTTAYLSAILEQTGTSPFTVALPAGSPLSGSMTLPGGTVYPSNTVADITLTNVAPASAPSLTTLLRKTAGSVRDAAAARRVSALQGAAVLGYAQIATTATLPLSASPSFSLSLPSSDVLTNASYFVALYDPLRPSLGWQSGFEGPGNLTGTTLTFAANPAPLTLTVQTKYSFALYAVSNAVASPTRAPSTAPLTPPPTSAPFTAAPSSMALNAGSSGTSTISDPTSYTGPYLVNVYDPNVATAPANGSSVTVTARTPSPRTLVDITDINGRLAVVSLVVPQPATAFPGDAWTNVFDFEDSGLLRALEADAGLPLEDVPHPLVSAQPGPTLQVTAGTVRIARSGSTSDVRAAALSTYRDSTGTCSCIVTTSTAGARSTSGYITAPGWDSDASNGGLGYRMIPGTTTVVFGEKDPSSAVSGAYTYAIPSVPVSATSGPIDATQTLARMTAPSTVTSGSNAFVTWNALPNAAEYAVTFLHDPGTGSLVVDTTYLTTGTSVLVPLQTFAHNVTYEVLLTAADRTWSGILSSTASTPSLPSQIDFSVAPLGSYTAP